MLKQTTEIPNLQTPFIFASETGIDLGAFEEVAFQHKVSLNNPIRFHLELTAQSKDIKDKEEHPDLATRRFFKALRTLNLDDERIQLEVAANYNKKQRQIAITDASVSADDNLIFRTYRKTTAENQAWHFEPDTLENKDTRVTWQHFIPRLYSNIWRRKEEDKLEAYNDLSYAIGLGLT